MAIHEVDNSPWIRKHDNPGSARTAPKIVYPTSLKDVVEICKTRVGGTRLHAAGSHWALSPAAVSDQVFVETHDPNESFAAMGRTLYEVVPKCLSTAFLEAMAAEHPVQFGNVDIVDDQTDYLVHVETGKRIYQLYAELDQGEDSIGGSLASVLKNTYGNDDYRGPWAFRTLGGAGGQTVFGALTTGTHGGDHYLPPIADDVAAIHLVTDGGKHYWIEPASQPEGMVLTDDDALAATYGTAQYGGAHNFKIIRDDETFNAVLVSAGRFGIVYSVVLRAVRQYSLHEERRLTTWQEIRNVLGDPDGPLYSARFLQIAVCLTPHHNFERNLAGITKRWNAAPLPDATDPKGRAERVGRLLDPFDPLLAGPRFEYAGNSHSYSPDPNDPNKAAPANFLERACASADFINGIIATAIQEIEDFLSSDEVAAGTAIAEVFAPGTGTALLILEHALAAILDLLRQFLDDEQANPSDRRLGEVMNDVKDLLLNRSDPNERAAGVFAWQLIAYKIFASEQAKLDYDAISYAVMDRHDYLDKSCNVNVDSIEVFFDATDPMLIGFIDALAAFEARQEFQGKAFVGYASLRFTGPTRALLGMSRYPLTCAVEIAGLKDVTGVTELIDFAIAMSLNRNFRGILHWGQRNEGDNATTEDRFGDGAHPPGGALGAWRTVLAALTDDGRLDAFSSEFTRKVGLEVS